MSGEGELAAPRWLDMSPPQPFLHLLFFFSSAFLQSGYRSKAENFEDSFGLTQVLFTQLLFDFLLENLGQNLKF